MTALQIFNNPQFGEIRAVEIDGKPYFVASDIAKVKRIWIYISKG